MKADLFTMRAKSRRLTIIRSLMHGILGQTFPMHRKTGDAAAATEDKVLWRGSFSAIAAVERHSEDMGSILDEIIAWKLPFHVMARLAIWRGLVLHRLNFPLIAVNPRHNRELLEKHNEILIFGYF
jgi:hypothetical protein